MTACPIRYQRQVSDRKGKIFYTSITSLSHISKGLGLVIIIHELAARRNPFVQTRQIGQDRQNCSAGCL